MALNPSYFKATSLSNSKRTQSFRCRWGHTAITQISVTTFRFGSSCWMSRVTSRVESISPNKNFTHANSPRHCLLYNARDLYFQTVYWGHSHLQTLFRFMVIDFRELHKIWLKYARSLKVVGKLTPRICYKALRPPCAMEPQMILFSSTIFNHLKVQRCLLHTSSRSMFLLLPKSLTADSHRHAYVHI